MPPKMHEPPLNEKVRLLEQHVQSLTNAVHRVGSLTEQFLLSRLGLSSSWNGHPWEYRFVLLEPRTRQEWEQARSKKEAGEVPEVPAPPWKHLVARPLGWRTQMYLKGRNMTVRQLLGTLKANKFSIEEAAQDLDLPVEAIREALEYAEQNRELIDLEASLERYLLRKRGIAHAPEVLP